MEEVAAHHEQLFATAFLEKRPPPAIAFDVDDVLEGERNVWLPKFYIDVKMNLSVLRRGFGRRKLLLT